MKVCDRHMDVPATEILESKITGETYDLCSECRDYYMNWMATRDIKKTAKGGRPKKK